MKRLRRVSMGLATVLGLAPRGFFIPYRYAGGVRDVGAGYPALERQFAAAAGTIAEWIGVIDGFADDLLAIDGSTADRARWDQDWFPRLDAAGAYSVVRRLAPGRIIEVGSGHSTRFMARAITDGGLETRLHAIDPQPRAAIADLPVTVTRTTLQDTGLDLFANLGPGDMLCVDSSHILMPGTDVDLVVNAILPGLPSGTVVFFHDIFLPDAYPRDWAWRGYNEHNAVGALLQGGYELMFASHYVATRMRDAIADTVIGRLPLVDGARESGLWLRKT